MRSVPASRTARGKAEVNAVDARRRDERKSMVAMRESPVWRGMS